MGWLLTAYRPDVNKLNSVYVGSDGWLYNNSFQIQTRSYGAGAQSSETSIGHFQIYDYKGLHYLTFESWGSQGYNGYYLSVDKNGYLGLYKWFGATSWALDANGHLLSQYNGQPVIIEGNRYRAAAGAPPLVFQKEHNGDLWRVLS